LPNHIVTLTTDFGASDHYVGAIKGVILKLNPQATIIDISNSVNSFDILDGAITIGQVYAYYPSDTIHMVIVDPGVGTARRPLLVTTEKHRFVAPDNGVLSLVYEREERLSVRHITAEHYFLQPISNTFHARDIFAPCAGWLSKGVEAAKFGDEIADFARFAAPKPKPSTTAILKGVVLKADKFGNLITNFTARDIPKMFEAAAPQFKIIVGGKEVTIRRDAYAQGMHNEVFAIIGSMGYLEIAANRGSAKALCAADRGTEVGIMIDGVTYNASPPAAATTT
jgi:S-adenosylmethionine hydrolase